MRRQAETQVRLAGSLNRAACSTRANRSHAWN